MLKHEDNETLVRVGPKTAAGSFFRLYWIPFLLSKDLVQDGEPVKVRLLGEDLVAFRDTEGQVGLVDHACAHRGAPLVFARNEECGLRCIYHGWKYSASGSVLDIPTEPQGSRFKQHVTIKAYRCVERNGVVWTYMGSPQEAAPPLPNFEWNLVPKENVVLSLRVQECNWLQALEGEIDSAHAPILHGRVDHRGAVNEYWAARRDLSPAIECVEQDFGLSIMARRKFDEAKCYWRVNQFVLPFFTLVPPFSKFPELSGHAWVPMDDQHTLCFMFSYHPSHAMYTETRDIFENGHNGREAAHASNSAYAPRSRLTPYARYWMKYNRANDYGFDYKSQQTTWFAGMPGLWVQDAACQCGEAEIYDRTREHLARSDVGVIQARQRLLKHIKEYRDTEKKPPRLEDPNVYMVRALAIVLPNGESLMEGAGAFMAARLGEDLGYDP